MANTVNTHLYHIPASLPVTTFSNQEIESPANQSFLVFSTNPSCEGASSALDAATLVDTPSSMDVRISSVFRLNHQLTQWELANPNEADRAEAKARILTCLRSLSNNLDLSFLEITSLPDVFSFEPFISGLQSLNLHNSRIKSLPDSLTQLHALKTLFLESTLLTSLPDSFGNLRALEYLRLNNTPLSSLPDSFRNLHALKILNLSKTRLSFLPTSFGHLIALEYLELNHTPMESFPDSISELHPNAKVHLKGCSYSFLIKVAKEYPNDPRFIYCIERTVANCLNTTLFSQIFH